MNLTLGIFTSPQAEIYSFTYTYLLIPIYSYQDTWLPHPSSKVYLQVRVYLNGISACREQGDEAGIADQFDIFSIQSTKGSGSHSINLQTGKELLLQISSMSAGKYLNTTYLVGCKLDEINTLQ